MRVNLKRFYHLNSLVSTQHSNSLVSSNLDETTAVILNYLIYLNTLFLGVLVYTSEVVTNYNSPLLCKISKHEIFDVYLSYHASSHFPENFAR